MLRRILRRRGGRGRMPAAPARAMHALYVLNQPTVVGVTHWFVYCTHPECYARREIAGTRDLAMQFALMHAADPVTYFMIWMIPETEYAQAIALALAQHAHAYGGRSVRASDQDETQSARDPED